MPKNVYGHLEALGVPADEPLLAEDVVRWRGQPIAAVAAEDLDAAMEALELIDVEYEERPTLFDIRLAFEPDAPEIHQWGPVFPHFGPHNHRRVREGDCVVVNRGVEHSLHSDGGCTFLEAMSPVPRDHVADPERDLVLGADGDRRYVEH